jgi:hypothetical protein
MEDYKHEMASHIKKWWGNEWKKLTKYVSFTIKSSMWHHEWSRTWVFKTHFWECIIQGC